MMIFIIFYANENVLIMFKKIKKSYRLNEDTNARIPVHFHVCVCNTYIYVCIYVNPVRKI